MFCGQNHAPATVPIFVHITLMNNKFLASLFYSKPRTFFLCQATDAFHFFLKKLATLFVDYFDYSFKREASFTLPSVAVTWSIFVTACFELEFSCCVSSSLPLPAKNYVILWRIYDIFPYSAVKIEIQFMRTVPGYMLLLKRTNDTIQIVYGFCNSFVTFQFSFCLIATGGL